MDTSDVLFSKLIEIMLEKSINFFSKLYNKKDIKVTDSFKSLETGFSIHINKSINFSQNISLFRHPDTLNLKTNSIELSIINQDRRFYSLNKKKNLNEIDILLDNNHHILLGDPGAGKTTTLKRLVSKSYESLFGENTNKFNYSFPIVVRLSEIQTNETLLIHLCHQLGIEYETIKKETPYSEIKEVYDEYFDDLKKETIFQKKQVEIKGTKIIYEYKIGNYPLKYAIGEYLNEINCILFLDGLDEINYLIKESVFFEIKEISNLISKSKIILTSRYLQEIPSFKKFNINEIEPLSDNQKRFIANLWLTNSELFFENLKNLPYEDLSDRPLFLTYLLRLFKANDNELPEQAIDIYRQVVLLAIREWDSDKEQEIKRYSKYKKFNTYKKEDFLSELSFELTYNQDVRKIFNHNQLNFAYINIYKRYPELTIEDRTDILKDIEAHNGLIIESSINSFEFSHLSLQEYLCAKYILSIPISRKHFEFLNIYPAPLSIANVLSPRPEEWFAMLFINNIGEKRDSYKIDGDKLYQFLDRLMIERIIFTKPVEELGLAILYLFFEFKFSKVMNKLIDFSKTEYIFESVQKVLKIYKIEEIDNQYHFTLKSRTETDYHIRYAAIGSVSVKFVKHLIN